MKQQETESNHTDPDLPITIDTNYWPKIMEAVEEYICQFCGLDGIPLSYVARQKLRPADAALDLAKNYSTLDETMIARAPILDPTAAGAFTNLKACGPFVDTYMTDHTMAWDTIANIYQDFQAWTYAKPAKHSRNGRQGYFGIYNYYLGPNNVDHMASMAEQRLQTTCYCGKTKRWNFDKYATLHKEQHHVLEGLKMHGYKGIDDRLKVRNLKDSIKTTKLDTVKAVILTSADHRSDFDGCVNLYKDFIKQNDMQPELRIAAIAADGMRTEDIIEGRSYKWDKYKSLTKGQKNYLRNLHCKCKEKEGNTPKAKGNGEGVIQCPS